jgi:energy-coupling factor transporter ATP-binding protein EcfA2
MAKGVKSLGPELERRLRRGEHLTLYGPRGIGKSTLLDNLHTRLIRAAVPCARSPSTAGLADITRTLTRAYPGIETRTLTQRATRNRLLLAAECEAAVLLLDHLTDVSTAMIGFLRRLRGGVAGVLLAVDVENERERQRLRGWRLGLSVRMPTASARSLRTLYRSQSALLHLPAVPVAIERHLIRAARGRPGWILQCTELIRQSRYWRNGTLRESVLCSDTEITLRHGHLRMLPVSH